MTHSFNERRIGGIEVITCTPDEPARGAPPLVLVHGAYTGAWVWAEKFMPRIARYGYASHALSLRGHGESFGGEHLDHHSIRDYCDDLKSVIEDIDENPVLVGHSMGGFVVQKYLEHHVAPAAVLMSSVPPQGLVAATFHLLMKRPGLLLEINRLLATHDISADVARDALFAKHVDDAILKRYLQRMTLESQRAIWDMSMFNLVNIPSVRRTPLMVLGAEHDLLIPPFLVNATAHSYAVPAHVFAGYGHGFLLEDGCEEIVDETMDWIESKLG
jgi:non-heme chloroperoxidase